MTNEEDIIVDLKCIMNCLISEDLCSIEPIEKAINSLQENTKLKAEIEQLKEEIEQSIKLPCKVGDIVYLLDFDKNKYDEATVEKIVITENGKIEINSDYEIGTWSEDTYIKYSLKEAEQSLKGVINDKLR